MLVLRSGAPLEREVFAKRNWSGLRQEQLELTEGFVRRRYGQYSVVGGAARVWPE